LSSQPAEIGRLLRAVKDYAKDDQSVCSFLEAILTLENEYLPHYTKVYRQLLEQHAQAEDQR